MKKVAVKIGFSVLGTLLVLGYWTFVDKKPPITRDSHIPEKVLGGGGDRLTIDVDVNGKAQVGMMLEQPRNPNGEQPLEEYYQNLDPGHHSFVVELAPNTMGTVDLRALDPQVGNRLNWTVTRNGKQIAQESDTLDKPLQAGYAQDLEAQLDSGEPSADQGSE